MAMTEIVVQLELEEWQRVLALLAKGPWEIANPLIMKVGEQLRRANGTGEQHATERKPAAN
jgi:hypothetical protein